MFPNLSNLNTLEISGHKRKAENDLSDIYFKAYRNGEFRKLSNLFGPVEWMYQQSKFKAGSEVYNFLEQGKQRTLQGSFTPEEFKTILNALGLDVKLKSYTDDDGALATGLIAQTTSQIAKAPDSDLGRKRLSFILGRSVNVSKDEALAWHAQNVNPELGDDDANALMLRILRVKYAIPQYRGLLLRSGTRALHEGKGRGAPNKWEWQNKPLTPQEEAKGFTRGGDVLGKLLMQVREEV